MPPVTANDTTLPPAYGKVYLVGAGPGDPGLITLRGKYLLEHAEVVVYDYLANPKLLSYVPQDARLIYAGKKGGGLHAFTQEGINKLLVELAKEGKMVVRLKGGDPFIFGRGAEEIEELVSEGIDFEVVPGVTSATAAATLVPLAFTIRRSAGGRMLLCPGNCQSTRPWPSMLNPMMRCRASSAGVRGRPARAR